MKLGDELSGELNLRNSDYDPKDVANQNRKSQTQKRFELIAKWLTVLARVEKNKCVKTVFRFVNSIADAHR